MSESGCRMHSPGLLSQPMSVLLRELASRSDGMENFYWPDFPSLEAL
jgi:hypothetical protein